VPALFAIAMGGLVGAVQRRSDLTVPLALVGALFVLLQVLPPIHQVVGANLGSRTATWLYDQLTTAARASHLFSTAGQHLRAKQ
jgi:ATP-binding cassette subfamily B protein